MRDIKYILFVPDGLADFRVPEFENKTPVEYAKTPMLDSIVLKSEVGLAQTLVNGLPTGSDVANMAVIGCDPKKYYTGRGPLECVSVGVEPKDKIAFRCNLVTVQENKMADFSAGHITTQESSELINFLQDNNKWLDVSFHPGVSYRHILLAPQDTDSLECIPPHDIVGQDIEPNLPKGSASKLIIDIMNWSKNLLENHPVNKARVATGKKPATQCWLWGQGRKVSLPSIKDEFGLEGGVVAAVELIRSLGILRGLESVNVLGATGFVDTNYEGKAQAALEILNRKDFVFVHIEAPDEAGHMGDFKLKSQSIEDIDARFLTPLLQGLQKYKRYRLLIVPDHYTPVSVGTHVPSDVPYLLFDSSISQKGVPRFTEENVISANTDKIAGHKLLEKLFKIGGENT